MWQKLHRTSEKYGLQSEILSFVTVKGDAEVHLVKITNIEEEEQEITPVAVNTCIWKKCRQSQRSQACDFPFAQDKNNGVRC